MHVIYTPTALDLPLFFNVDSSVGDGGDNSSSEDVMLVQFFLAIAGENLQGTPPPSGVSAIDWQSMIDLCVSLWSTGECDEATIDAIRAFQTAVHDNHPAIIVDGRVSVARGFTYAPHAAWTIANMNFVIRTHFPRIWPRLQDHPQCPGALKTRFPKVL